MDFKPKEELSLDTTDAERSKAKDEAEKEVSLEKIKRMNSADSWDSIGSYVSEERSRDSSLDKAEKSKKPVLRKKSLDRSIESPKEISYKKNKRERKPLKAGKSNAKVFEFDPTNLPKIVDVVFCCDATASMDPFIEGSKDTMERMMQETIETFKGVEVKFGFVAYRDHKDKVMLEIKDLANSEEVIEFMDNVDAKGGGDIAEAVHDGLHAAVTKISWRTSDNSHVRMIFHVTDAPPHGKEYWPSSHFSDYYPDGCPCGIKLSEIADKINELGIKYVLMKIGSQCEKMKVLFKQSFENVKESTTEVEASERSEEKGDMDLEFAEAPSSKTKAKKEKARFRALSISDADDLEEGAMECFGDELADFGKD